MFLPCCSYIAWPIHRLQSDVRGAFIPIFMGNQKITLCWCYGAAASRDGPSFPPLLIACFFLHCVCTTLCWTGFEAWFGWKQSFGFTPSYFSARSGPCSDYWCSHRLGNSGTRREQEHQVRATHFCRSQTASAQCPWAQGNRWAEPAEQEPGYSSSTVPTAAPTPTLPSRFAPTRGQLRLCRPRRKRRPLLPARWVCLWEVTGMGNGVLPVSATGPLVPARWWLHGGAEIRYTSWWSSVPRVFSLLIVCLYVPQPWVCLRQDKPLQRLFLAVRILCVPLWP